MMMIYVRCDSIMAKVDNKQDNCKVRSQLSEKIARSIDEINYAFVTSLRRSIYGTNKQTQKITSLQFVY